VTAHDISPDAHLEVQAAFQRHCDSGISKTINFPAGASATDVSRLYLKAFHAGLKGVTVYRDGSRPGQPMALSGDSPAGACSAGESCPECE
jgi:ribonucleoside-diphosphate reductase alpha chain